MVGINKAEDPGRIDPQIGFADALRRVFQTALPSLDCRGWIDQETLCNRMSKHIFVAMRPKKVPCACRDHIFNTPTN